MSKFKAKKEKAGIKTSPKDTGKSKSKVETLKADKATIVQVDNYLKAKHEMENFEAQMKDAAESIRNFAYMHYFNARSMDNFILEGLSGIVNVNVKEQYTLSTEKQAEELRGFLKSKGENPDDYVSEETNVKFKFDKMTDKEQDAMFEFIKKKLGDDRYEELVIEEVKYKIKGLKDKMPIIAKTADEFQEIRQVSKHHAPTVTEYTPKK